MSDPVASDPQYSGCWLLCWYSGHRYKCATHRSTWKEGCVVLLWVICNTATIAVITVEPAVLRFLRESEAFGSSFWRESVYVSSVLTFWLFCCTSDSFYRWWGIAQPMDAPTEVTRWDGGTYRGISIALSIWTFSSSEEICVWRNPYNLLEWVHYFHCWSWPKRHTFMRFHLKTAELHAQL